MEILLHSEDATAATFLLRVEGAVRFALGRGGYLSEPSDGSRLEEVSPTLTLAHTPWDGGCSIFPSMRNTPGIV
jgi:hypothetical protein